MRLRLASLAALAASVSIGGTALAAGELHIYNWADYTSPELVAKFENEYDVKVTLETYESSVTMLDGVRGGARYDIVVAADYIVKIMIGEGLLAETKPNQMETFRNVDPRWIDVYWDPGRNYSVPWQIVFTSFTVDTAVYAGDINTLSVLFDPPNELKGRINMLEDVTLVVRAAERYLGVPHCTSEPEHLQKVNDLLTKAKSNWRSSDNNTIRKLTSGEVSVSQNWSAYSWHARQLRPTLTFAYPKEGTDASMDNVVVLREAPNLENAKLFQKFIMAPENAALISKFSRNANGITGSDRFLEPEFAHAPEIQLPVGAAEPEFVPPCSHDFIEQHNKIWIELLK
jgi:spermidine/putrescine transport system substrate-binding protein